MPAVRDRRLPDQSARAAGRRLLKVYASLAKRGEHLLDGVLAGRAPKQWAHYPEDDAIDREHGYQWFYHSHSPADRPGAAEHGHLHLFARRKLWSRRLQSREERAFARLGGGTRARIETRHLLCIGFDSKGLPNSLFTVNSWVTGDLMLGAANTASLLAAMKLHSGNREIDAVIECVVALCQDEIRTLLAARDLALFRSNVRNVLRDESLEVLSEVPVNLDRKIQAACG